MKKFLKNLRNAYFNCWNSDVMPIWCFLHIIVGVVGIVTIDVLIPNFLPFLACVVIVACIIGCLAHNWESDEN